MKFLQKLGKALMLPVACLPICGILMVSDMHSARLQCRVVTSQVFLSRLGSFLLKQVVP